MAIQKGELRNGGQRTCYFVVSLLLTLSRFLRAVAGSFHDMDLVLGMSSVIGVVAVVKRAS